MARGDAEASVIKQLKQEEENERRASGGVLPTYSQKVGAAPQDWTATGDVTGEEESTSSDDEDSEEAALDRAPGPAGALWQVASGSRTQQRTCQYPGRLGGHGSRHSPP